VIYTGRIATGAIAKKALKIRQEMKKSKMGFIANEADSVLPFCKKFTAYMLKIRAFVTKPTG
jgi:hypothetical protein